MSLCFSFVSEVKCNGSSSWNGEIDYIEQSFYDNLDRVIQVDRRNTNSNGNLLSRSETRYDDRGRTYQFVGWPLPPPSERSEFTSAYERIQARETEAKLAPPPRANATVDATDISAATVTPEPVESARDGWLSPLELSEHRERSSTRPTRRASHRGFLPMTVDDYLRLLDWTGRAVRRDKHGSIPAHLSPILARLQVSSETWVATVQHFGRWFRRAVGRATTLSSEATRRGLRWLSGISHSRAAFG